MALYTSKTNSVQVQIAKKKTKSEGEFLIEYKGNKTTTVVIPFTLLYDVAIYIHYVMTFPLL